MKGKMFLIHWHEAEAAEYVDAFRAKGWEVDFESADGACGGQTNPGSPPDVVVIYLSRLPSHGRETAHALRSYKVGRTIPIVFVDGKDETLEKTRVKVPDAIFATSAELEGVLAQVVRA